MAALAKNHDNATDPIFYERIHFDAGKDDLL